LLLTFRDLNLSYITLNEIIFKRTRILSNAFRISLVLNTALRHHVNVEVFVCFMLVSLLGTKVPGDESSMNHLYPGGISRPWS